MSKIKININSSTIALMLIFIASGTFFGIANAQNMTDTPNSKNLSLPNLYELVEKSIVEEQKHYLLLIQ